MQGTIGFHVLTELLLARKLPVSSAKSSSAYHLFEASLPATANIRGLLIHGTDFGTPDLLLLIHNEPLAISK